MRIGVNALYLIPGKVGGTEIYLRNLLPALAAIDRENEYLIFVNRDFGGAVARVTSDVADLRRGVWNDRISSIRVY